MATPDGLPSISRHRYEGYSLETKYGWMQQGGGSAEVTGAADFLTRLARDFADSEQAVRVALGELGVRWEGTAAASASAALAEVADWARASAENSTAGGSAIDDYADSFARLKPRIPRPPEDDAPPVGVAGGMAGSIGADFHALTGLGSDHRERLARRQRLDRAANDALYAHEANARAAVRAFPVPERW